LKDHKIAVVAWEREVDKIVREREAENKVSKHKPSRIIPGADPAFDYIRANYAMMRKDAKIFQERYEGQANFLSVAELKHVEGDKVEAVERWLASPHPFRQLYDRHTWDPARGRVYTDRDVKSYGTSTVRACRYRRGWGRTMSKATWI
jgi:hypothetical protein